MTLGGVFRFWLPLGATWLMMSVEGPFLAAVIARLADPAFNLAAHGVAYAFAILVEAPVIMIMSAATALVADESSFRRLRNFTFALNLVVTGVMLVLLIPAIYETVMLRLVGLPREVAGLTYGALWILLPWPGAIGYRRFYQGVLIREGATRRVAYGTVLRLIAMSVTALVLYVVIAPPGVYVGAAALSVGVTIEALASRWMARDAVRAVRTRRDTSARPLTYQRILHFYYPLALTSVIGLVVQPMLTFFMGRAPSPVESLAVFPVVHALSFIFRAMGLSFQEVAIALLGEAYERLGILSRFALMLGVAASGGLAAVALTPAAIVWFETISGLSADLARFAILPAMLFVPIPFMSVLLSFERAILVIGGRTRPISMATLLEVIGVALTFTLLVRLTTIPGVTAAVVSFMVGRVSANLYLIPACRAAIAARRGRS